MNSDQVQAVNGFVAIDLLHIKPSRSGLKLYNPHNGQETGSRESYSEHPFQALVIKCPRVFNNGGLEYDSLIEEGDVALLTGYPIPERTHVLNLDGRIYPIVRYAEIIGFYKPTEEQRAKFEFMQDLIEKPKETIEEIKKKPPMRKMNLEADLPN